MIGDFAPEDVSFPPPSPRFREAMQPEHHGWEDVDAYAVPAVARRVRSARQVRVPRSLTRKEKNKLARAHKKMVRTDIKLGRCESAFHGLLVLRGSGLPGAKVAAAKLGRAFANKCLRVKCARSKR